MRKRKKNEEETIKEEWRNKTYKKIPLWNKSMDLKLVTAKEKDKIYKKDSKGDRYIYFIMKKYMYAIMEVLLKK